MIGRRSCQLPGVCELNNPRSHVNNATNLVSETAHASPNWLLDHFKTGTEVGSGDFFTSSRRIKKLCSHLYCLPFSTQLTGLSSSGDCGSLGSTVWDVEDGVGYDGPPFTFRSTGIVGSMEIGGWMGGGRS